MTIGLTSRRTARRIKRLKEGVFTISPDYSDRDPRLFGALRIRRSPLAPRFRHQSIITLLMLFPSTMFKSLKAGSYQPRSLKAETRDASGCYCPGGGFVRQMRFW